MMQINIISVARRERPSGIRGVDESSLLILYKLTAKEYAKIVDNERGDFLLSLYKDWSFRRASSSVRMALVKWNG